MQLFLICCSGILGIGLFSVPTAAAYFGQTAYWLILLGGALCALVVVLLCSVTSAHPLPEVWQSTFPKVGKSLSLFYALFYTVLSAFVLAYYTHTLRGWFLEGVPHAVLVLFLVGVCTIAAAKPKKSLYRSIALLTAFVLIAVVTMRSVMLASGDIRNLLPVYETVTLKNPWQGVLFVSGFFVLSGIIGNIHAPRRTKLLAGGGAVLVCTLVFLLASAACISMLGPMQTASHLNSSVLAMKNLNLSELDFFQRSDLVFMLTWSVLILSAGALCLSIPMHTFQTLFPKGNPIYSSLAPALFCITVALLAESEESALLCLIYTAIVGGAALTIVLLFTLLKRRNNGIKRLLCLLPLFGILTGCYPYTEIENMDILTSWYADRQNGELILGGGIANVRSFSDTMAEDPVSLLRANGANLETATQNLRQSADHELFYGALRAVIFGEGLAKENITQTLRYLDAQPRLRRSTAVFVTDADIESVVEYKAINDFSGGFAAESILTTLDTLGEMHTVTVGDIVYALSLGDAGYCVPHITVENGLLRTDGYRLFIGGRMVGKTRNPAVVFFTQKNATQQHITNGTVLTTVLKKKQLTIREKDNILHVDADFTFALRQGKNSDTLKAARHKETARQLEKKLKTEIEEALVQVRETGCDFLELYQYRLAQSRSDFDMQVWNKQLKTMTFNVSVTIE